MMKVIRDPSDIALNPFSIYTWEYFLYIIFMMVAILSIALTTLCYMRLYQDYDRQAPAVADVWSMFKDYFLSYFVGSFLFGVLTVIGFVFCFAPGIWLWPIMSLATALIVLRDNTIGDAFNDAFKLIKDNWWTTFGAMFIMMIIYYMCSMLITLPAAAFTMSGIFFGSKPKINVPLTILGVVLQNVCLLFHMLIIVITGMCYYSLSEQKEGTGLSDRIDNFGQNTKDSGPEEEY